MGRVGRHEPRELTADRSSCPSRRIRTASTITGPNYKYIVSGGASVTLNYPAATLDKSQAKLTHRVHLDDTPQEVPSTGWNYNADGTAISLVGGNFVNNDIYEFSYIAKDPDGQRHRLRRNPRLHGVAALRGAGRRAASPIRWPATSTASTRSRGRSRRAC